MNAFPGSEGVPSSSYTGSIGLLLLDLREVGAELDEEYQIGGEEELKMTI